MPITHEVEIHKVERSGFRIRGLSLLGAGIAIAIIAWGYLNLASTALLGLTLVAALPVLAILVAMSYESGSDVRIFGPGIALLSFLIGIPICWLNKEAFSDVGRKAESIRRALPIVEQTSDVGRAAEKLGSAPFDIVLSLHARDQQRVAIQLARFGQWEYAQRVWKLTAVSYGQKAEMRVSSLMSKINQVGVSKASLLPLCQDIYLLGFKAQSVSLWRAYYPKDVPSSWRRVIEAYSP